MSEVTWDRCRRGFEWDGSLRDIYVLNASLADWDTFVQTLPGMSYRTEFLIDDAAALLPAATMGLFERRADHAPLLRLFAGPVMLCCHFFSDQELEFDLDPREVQGAPEFQGVLDFMRNLGGVLGKPVILTPENQPEHPMISYDPRGGQFECHE